MPGGGQDRIYDLVTEKMIAALERGTVPWRRPWGAASGSLPMSMATGNPYRGVNVWLLALEASERGYASPWWGTYDQITALGGQVRRGEKHTKVVWWHRWQVPDSDPDADGAKTKIIPLLRHYRVHNAEQADGLKARFYPPPDRPVAVIETAEQITAGYLSRPGAPQVTHAVPDRAFYRPGPDLINLPPPDAFRSPAHRYATAFHECVHSTGHPARLDRPGIASFDHFGSEQYSREELVAEMGAAMLCAVAGIDAVGITENSAAYLASWLGELRNDRRLVVTASYAAQRAADLVRGIERQPDRDTPEAPGQGRPRSGRRPRRLSPVPAGRESGMEAGP